MKENSSSIQIQPILAFFGFLGRAGPGRGISEKSTSRAGPGWTDLETPLGRAGKISKIWTPKLEMDMVENGGAGAKHQNLVKNFLRGAFGAPKRAFSALRSEIWGGAKPDFAPPPQFGLGGGDRPPSPPSYPPLELSRGPLFLFPFLSLTCHFF